MEDKKKKVECCRFAHHHSNGGCSCTKDGFKEAVKTDEVKCEACDKYKSRYIEYPITVNSIDTQPIKYDGSWHSKIGQLVAVRPCGEEYGNKTYAGIYLGDLPLYIYHSLNEESGVLRAGIHNNPAMFVPELRKIIFGCASWWKTIDSVEDAKEISDQEITKTWYVQLLKLQQNLSNNGKEDSE